MLRKFSTVVVVFAAVQAAHAQVHRASPGVDAIPSVYLISSGERSDALVAIPAGVTLDIDNDVLVQTDSDSDGNANIAVILKDTPTIYAEVWSDLPLRVGDRIMEFEEIGTDDDTGETFYWMSVQEPNHYLFVDLAHGTVMVIEVSVSIDLVTRQNQRVIQSHVGCGAFHGVRDGEGRSGCGRIHSSCGMLDACFNLGHNELPVDLEDCADRCDLGGALPGFCGGDGCLELCRECLGL